MNDGIEVKYLGHACFKLTYGDWSLVIDPYIDGMVPGLAPLRIRANAVYCSHGHDDHSYTEAVTIIPADGDSPFEVTEFMTPHDDAGGAKRGMNTVRVFSAGGLRVAHMGDVGRPLTEAEAALLKGVDVLLIPVGGCYTIDAKQAKDMVCAIKPRIVIPMHYRCDGFGFPVIGRVEEFTELFDEVSYAVSPVTVTEDSPEGVIVMTAGA